MDGGVNSVVAAERMADGAISALSTAMRGMKAEGGWAVVCTEMTEIHQTSDVAPSVELRLWSDQDIPMHARIAEKIHEHHSLAGVELSHSGYTSSNLWSREIPMAPMAMPTSSYFNDPVQARVMDKQDIKNLRRAHRAAALRARTAGYDLVYVYAGHGVSIFQQFLSRAPPISGTTNMVVRSKTVHACCAK